MTVSGRKHTLHYIDRGFIIRLVLLGQGVKKIGGNVDPTGALGEDRFLCVRRETSHQDPLDNERTIFPSSSTVSGNGRKTVEGRNLRLNYGSQYHR